MSQSNASRRATYAAPRIQAVAHPQRETGPGALIELPAGPSRPVHLSTRSAMRLSSTRRDRLVQTATGAGLALLLAVLALASPTPAMADGHVPIAQQPGIVDGFDGAAASRGG